MKLKLATTISALVAAPALALAQQGGSPPIGPKPTKADIQKVIQIITRDKAKTKAYCDLNKLYEQMDAAEQKNDSETVQALDKQADALFGKLGPEYSKVMGGLVQIDPNSSEGKKLESMLSGLHKVCRGT
jgi:gamma-glutamyltranspeptidase